MGGTIYIQALDPGALSTDERKRFMALVIDGGEVASVALSTNVVNARVVVLVRENGVIRGIGALKRPQWSYREKVGKKAALILSVADLPFELGYIYLEQPLRGRGLSHRIVASALAHNDAKDVFATVRTENAGMRATLQKAGFVPAGTIYPGSKIGTEIGVLIRDLTS